ncbi:hypothetical protein LN996_16660 [Arthrobacter sp. AK01]|uniref:type II secretion system F family protein n=1 Tax=Micrococcaceae TaxID=1268 RepID=UPI001E331792|nr:MULTISPECIES: hypothetical protein [Micrococcaceae]MCD4852448.1 hypothetical protein [Arthrobacter sp. AK01]MCP1415347.1 tight adherence protein B [Paenarthrobacter sp. A20]
MGAFVLVAMLAAWLQLRGHRADGRRVRRSLGEPARGNDGYLSLAGLWSGRLWRRKRREAVSLVVLVQQLAALLRGGRGTSSLWEELWAVHAPRLTHHGSTAPETEQVTAGLTPESLLVVAAARAASTVGNPPADAIRQAVARMYPRRGSSERRVWMELAACLEVSETSGCPLADLLTRFAAQLEAEEDAEAARQTALAGPKATVRLLSWLPVFGLVLGMALGVDPLGILLDNFLGVATFAAGLLLTVVGRVWSSRLVASAAGGM